jgi:hypothetical protein
VDRLLTCPSCAGSLTFAEWSKTACCPHCGARVNLIAASSAAAAGGPAPGSADGPAPAATATAASGPRVATAAAASDPMVARFAPAGGSPDTSAAVSPVAAGPEPPSASSGERLYAFGKPLALTRAWIVVFAIWAVAAGSLVAARIEMGHLPLLSARELAAIASVEKARMADGTTFAQALQLARQASDPLRGLTGQVPLGNLAVKPSPPRWYVIDRPWEHKVYVAWELDDQLSGQVLRLVWTVKGKTVKAEPASYAFLKEVVKAAAKNPPGTATSPVVLPDPDALATAEPSPTAP